MNEIINVTLSQLRLVWRQILAIHLIYIGLGIIVFAPLLGVLGQVLLKLSGQPALADMDLLFFALSPTGLIALVLFAAITLVISAFELTSMMAIGAGIVPGKSIDIFTALIFSLSKVRQIFLFAARLIVKLLIIATPFLLIGSMIAFLLISDYDVNYYLAVRPLEFWLALIALGSMLIVMLVIIVSRLVNWSLALPLVLFSGTAPADSFAASAQLTQPSRHIILSGLILWIGITILLGVAVTVSMQLLAAILAPLSIDSVTSLAILFGLLSVLWSLASLLVTGLATGTLALSLAALTHKLEPRCHAFDMKPAQWRLISFSVQKRHWFVAGFIATLSGVTLLGFSLLDEIQITDDVQIIAHRGASAAAPENSMASIKRAITDGADWIEIDVQETVDGEIVVIHDSDFMKLAGVNLKVWEATLQQVADIDIGSSFAPEFAGEPVPTLAAVLAEVKGRAGLIVELKYYGHAQQLEQRVIDLIEAADMQDDTMIMSLEYAGIQQVRVLRPDWKVGLLSARAIGDLTRLDADFLAVNIALARPALVQAAHAAEKEFYVWTVNDALSMSQMMSLGVDGIITDEPLLGRQVLAARAELSSVQRLLLHMALLYGLEPPSLGIESDDAGTDITNNSLELSLQQRFQDRITSPGTVLTEFATDGCSGGLSVGWDYFAKQAGFFRERHGTQPPWESCCIEHDRKYHKGGGAGLTALESFSARELADDELRACVLATANERASQLREDYGLDAVQVAKLYEVIADSIYTAVRLGGMPCTGLSWRWGYGWPDCD